MLKTAKESTGIDALLGQNTSFNGTLAFDGIVRIDGNFEGKIKTNDTLVIAEYGKVSADVEAGVVKIMGEFSGTIIAKTKVEMFKPALVQGKLSTPSIRMEEGVIFNGTAEMSNLTQSKGIGSPTKEPPKN
ncbi:MAG: polymer-forming cytoskeletal protein [Deferribacteraceae bacterium]|jgi:cytoskeletal protein CcmA (bactofilin family)|nr:polymer-forming cytoskeletal protein [Deferribacteraceae bacterium]